MKHPLLTDEQRRDILRFFEGTGRFAHDLRDLEVAQGLNHSAVVRSLVTAGLLDPVYGSTRGRVYTLSALGQVVLRALE